MLQGLGPHRWQGSATLMSGRRPLADPRLTLVVTAAGWLNGESSTHMREGLTRVGPGGIRTGNEGGKPREDLLHRERDRLCCARQLAVRDCAGAAGDESRDQLTLSLSRIVACGRRV